MDGIYTGTILAFAFDFEPRGFLRCDGKELHINEFQALYSLIGNKFGGSPGKTFKLPALSGPDRAIGYYICVEGLYPPRQ